MDRWYRTEAEWREARELLADASARDDLSPLRRLVLAWRAPVWCLDFYIESESDDRHDLISDVFCDVEAATANLTFDYRVIVTTEPLPPVGDQEELFFERKT